MQNNQAQSVIVFFRSPNARGTGVLLGHFTCQEEADLAISQAKAEGVIEEGKEVLQRAYEPSIPQTFAEWQTKAVKKTTKADAIAALKEADPSQYAKLVEVGIIKEKKPLAIAA